MQKDTEERHATKIVATEAPSAPLIEMRGKTLFVESVDPELDLKVSSKGHVEIECRSMSILVEEEFCVDSKMPDSVPSLFLNSKMCRQIRHDKSSIEYRQSQFDKAWQALTYAANITGEHQHD